HRVNGRCDFAGLWALARGCRRDPSCVFSLHRRCPEVSDRSGECRRPSSERVARSWAMIAWSPDPQVAERQMQAVIFCLVAFAYIDEEFDRSEKKYIVDHIAELVNERAATIADPAERADVAARWSKH